MVLKWKSKEIQTPKKLSMHFPTPSFEYYMEFIAVIVLKFEQCMLMCPKHTDKMANSVDPDQTAAVYLGLHSLPSPAYPNI